MVRIRLRRVGAKKQPSYRIVIADQHSPRNGRFIESIGFYNPRTEPETVEYDEERALHWLSVGAQPSNAVRRLLVKHGTLVRLERFHKGEALEALVQEAVAEAEARPPISPKTRHEPPTESKRSKKTEEEAPAEAPEAEEAVEAAAEVEVAEEETAEGEAETVDEEAVEAAAEVDVADEERADGEAVAEVEVVEEEAADGEAEADVEEEESSEEESE